MRYIMKKRFRTLFDDFLIYDAQDNEVYTVNSKRFRIFKQLSFRDMENRELAFIRQKVIAWNQVYEIFKDGKLVASVEKKIFSLTGSFFKAALIDGSSIKMQYNFYRHDIKIAHLSRNIISIPETLEVDINDNEDHILILCLAVINRHWRP